jgi:glucose/arabinose dehydrogenase
MTQDSRQWLRHTNSFVVEDQAHLPSQSEPYSLKTSCSMIRSTIAQFRVRFPCLGLFISLTVACRISGAELPPGFVEETIADGINGATAMAIARDGRIFVCEQTGTLRVVKEGKWLPNPFFKIEVDSFWERGLIGVTLHPDFPKTPFAYVVYVAAKPYPHHVVSRFTADDNAAVAGSEKILLEGDDQTKLGGSIPAGHQGGPIRFGPDGKLYTALGEQTAGAPSQDLKSLLGKVLRLNPDASIPEDNPFYSTADGKYRAIWAYGLRNPFGLAFQPVTGRLFENDVGQSSWEEVNEIVRGGNYGWPQAEGTSTNAAFRNPIHAYPPLVGRSITGGVFYNPPVAQFPTQYVGKYFFLDYMAHWLKVLDPDNSKSVTIFAKNLNGPVDVQLAPDGSLCVLNRAAWVRDNKFTPNSGSLVRIRYTGQPVPGATASERTPRKLSETDLFKSLTDLQPRSDFIPFELNAPVWLPGVQARRWIFVPSGQRIRFSIDEEWSFPPGTIFIQHFEVGAKPAGGPARRLETHVIWIRAGGCPRAVAYRWDEHERDASRVEDGEVVSMPGQRKLHWFSPGTEDCLNLETVTSGFLLQVNTRQLNRDVTTPRTETQESQLRSWNRRGLFRPPLREEDFARLPRLAAVDDTNAPPELRVRSYLDANCAVCHRPGGLSKGFFDARFAMPLLEQKIINGELMAGDLGISGAKVVVPGSVEKSILYQRLKRTDFFRMPPVSVNDVLPPVLPALEEWIRELK